MFLAEEAVAASTSVINVFDYFVLAFTILIAVAVFRSLTAKKRNLLAIGFSLVSLGLFLFMDFVMISGWF